MRAPPQVDTPKPAYYNPKLQGRLNCGGRGMRRYSFSTFEVDDANREAFEACQAVAELEPGTAGPIVLLGGAGAGKTHLLYSIVNYIRAGANRAGLAYVTARRFPREVRALATDPSPVQRAPAAILLVDQLEGFREHLDELEAVVRTFLSQGHYVVLASRVHPARLKDLPESLRALLDGGRVLQIRPAESRPRRPPAAQGFPTGAEDLVRKQRDEICQLREQLQRAEEMVAGGGKAGDAAEELRRELEAERARVEEYAAAAATAEVQAATQLDQLRRELEEQRNSAQRAVEAAATAEVQAATQLEELRRKLDEQRDSMKRRATETGRAGDEAGELRRQLEAARLDAEDQEARLRLAERERGEAQGERDALSVQLEEKARVEEDAAALRRDLAQIRSEKDQAEHEAEVSVQRAEAVLEEVEARRAAFAEAERHQRDQVRELEAMVDALCAETGRLAEIEGTDARAAEALEQLAALRNEYDRAREDLGNELAAVHDDLGQTIQARDDAIERLNQLTVDMDALRREAAAQVAAANAQAGEIERKYARLALSFDGARETGHLSLHVLFGNHCSHVIMSLQRRELSGICGLCVRRAGVIA